MSIDIHLYHHFPDGWPDPRGIERVLAAIRKLGRQSMKEFEDLTAEIAANGDIEASAAAGITHLEEMIAALGDAPTAQQLADLRSTVAAQKDALAAAIATIPPT